MQGPPQGSAPAQTVVSPGRQVGRVHPQSPPGAGPDGVVAPQGHWYTGQQSLDWPTTIGGTPPGQAGRASVHAAGRDASHCPASGSQRKAGQQSSTAVPIHRCVPGGQTGAGVVGQAPAARHAGWQLTCAQQSPE